MTILRKLLLCCCLLAGQWIAAQDGYKIDIQIDGFEQDTAYLGYFMGASQYLLDTVTVDNKGRFTFRGDEPLPGGVYLGILPPDNKYFQILISEGEQHFMIKTNLEDLVGKMSIKGSDDNTRFYEYLQFISDQRKRADQLDSQLDDLEEVGDEDPAKQKLIAERKAVDQAVQDYQAAVIQTYPKSMSALLMKANLPPAIPDFVGLSEKDRRAQQLAWLQEHYFDDIDLTDPRVLRTPFFYQRVKYYTDKLHVQHPDTIIQVVDIVLEQLRPAPETFKFWLLTYLNHYAASKYVGMDAVYVHLVENYYAKGDAPWTTQEQLNNILKDARALKPLLLGKVAPNIQLQTRDQEPVALHDIESEYIVLYFWRPDCPHCKKSMPFLKDFFAAYADRGVQLVAICTKFTDEVENCWKYIDENQTSDWMHLVDPFHRSKFMKIYDMKSTPQIYILDKDKKIISKKLAAEQLSEVMERLMEMHQDTTPAHHD